MIIETYLMVLLLTLMAMGGILLVARMRQCQAVKNLRAVSQVDLTRYQPMLRLLSEDDLNLVVGDKTLVRQLRRQRVRVVRGYLRCMTKDYAALYAAVRRTMVDATEDRPDLANLLLNSQVNFAVSSVMIETRLCLYRFGIGAIDLSELTNQIGQVKALIQDPA